MLYIIQILSAILIGISVGAIASQRNTLLLSVSIIAIILAGVTIVTGSWILLAIGTAIFLIGQGAQRDTVKA